MQLFMGQNAINGKTTLVQLYLDLHTVPGGKPTFQARNADSVVNPTTNFPASSYPIALVTLDTIGRIINLQDCRT